jgi:hypothetical protein
MDLNSHAFKFSLVLVAVANACAYSKGGCPSVFVDPVNGSDSNSGKSADAALHTIARAMDTVRFFKKKNHTDTCVVLLDGRYQLNETLHLPSGVKFDAVNGRKATISGGIAVSDWSRVDTAHNLWSAPVPAELPESRQFYVNGNRANRSHYWFNQAAKVTALPTGLLVEDRGLGGWLDHDDSVELVWTGGCKAHSAHCAPGEHSYREARCKVESVTRVSARAVGMPQDQEVYNVTVVRPCFDNARLSGCGVPSAVENLRSLVVGTGPLNYRCVCNTTVHFPTLVSAADLWV